jgi:hypothetical protein
MHASKFELITNVTRPSYDYVCGLMLQFFTTLDMTQGPSCASSRWHNMEIEPWDMNVLQLIATYIPLY